MLLYYKINHDYGSTNSIYLSTKSNSAAKNGKGIIIDVREPAEFRDGHLPGAINLPFTQYTPESFQQWNHQEKYIICQSGNRATKLAEDLKEKEVTDLFVLQQHMEYINAEKMHDGWSVDRQFRFFLGLLIAIYLIGSSIGSNNFIFIPIILCSGLIITAIIDKCYLHIGIAMMPWNRDKPTPQ